MGQVNYYLKKAEKSGLSLIYLQFKYSGNRFKYSFGQSIDPKNWNSNKQRVKENKQTTSDGQHSLNDLLDNLEATLLSKYRKELANGIPPKAILKECLDNFINKNKELPDQPTFHNLLNRFISGEILHKGKKKSPNTIKTYKTFQKHLIEFEKKKNVRVDYQTINLDFLYKYISFLETKGLNTNARAKDVQILKTIMKKAVTLKQTTNLWFEHEDFTAERQESDSVYLTDKEILKLWKHDFSNNKRLEGIRDLFVFGCYVGLRYSDYSTVKPENIVEIEGRYFIKMITTKTKALVVIPTNPIILKIFDRYKDTPNKLPKTLSNQKFNDAIKEVCKEAGFDELGRLATDPSKPLYKCISSHTARRSMATNTYLSGFPVIDLMKITGHTTERAFMKYIRHTKLDAAKRLDQHIQKQWSNILLQAV